MFFNVCSCFFITSRCFSMLFRCFVNAVSLLFPCFFNVLSLLFRAFHNAFQCFFNAFSILFLYFFNAFSIQCFFYAFQCFSGTRTKGPGTRSRGEHGMQVPVRISLLICGGFIIMHDPPDIYLLAELIPLRSQLFALD